MNITMLSDKELSSISAGATAIEYGLLTGVDAIQKLLDLGGLRPSYIQTISGGLYSNFGEVIQASLA